MDASSTKICVKCKQSKHPSDFGYLRGDLNPRCFECCRKVGRKHLKTEKYKETHAKYVASGAPAEYKKRVRQTEEGKAKIATYVKDFRSKNPEKDKAYEIVHKAIERGDLGPLPCENCDSIENLEAHHDDYSKPLDIRWLCIKCHAKLHHGGLE